MSDVAIRALTEGDAEAHMALRLDA